MSELCRFHGIVIMMFFREHPPPHFHVVYGDYNASIDIVSLRISEGILPRRVERMVLEWATLRQTELSRAWDLASNLRNPGKIKPLD